MYFEGQLQVRYKWKSFLEQISQTGTLTTLTVDWLFCDLTGYFGKELAVKWLYCLYWGTKHAFAQHDTWEDSMNIHIPLFTSLLNLHCQLRQNSNIDLQLFAYTSWGSTGMTVRLGPASFERQLALRKEVNWYKISGIRLLDRYSSLVIDKCCSHHHSKWDCKSESAMYHCNWC